MICKKNYFKNRGFSRTEVMVVSSLSLIVISIVVAFVVGGINGKANDSRMIEGMKSLRKESEIFYLTNNRSYGNFCLEEPVLKMNHDFKYFNCYDSPSHSTFGAWAAESKIMSRENEFYCADYTGHNGFTNGSTISHEDFLCDFIINEVKETI